MRKARRGQARPGGAKERCGGVLEGAVSDEQEGQCLQRCARVQPAISKRRDLDEMSSHRSEKKEGPGKGQDCG